MIINTQQAELDLHLTIFDATKLPLLLRIISLTLIKQNDEILKCHLTFCVTPELYQRIETKALFNLKPELCTPLTNGNFQPSPDIQIEAILKPDLLPLLLENATNADEAAAYLLNLSQQQSELTSEIQKTNESPYLRLFRYIFGAKNVINV